MSFSGPSSPQENENPYQAEMVNPASGPSVPTKERSFSVVRLIIGIACWFFIIGFVVMQLLTPYEPETAEGGKDFAIGMAENIQAKYFVGARELTPNSPVPVEETQGTYNQRLSSILLELEIEGEKDAKKSLEKLDEHSEMAGYQPTENEQKTRRLVGEIINGDAEKERARRILPDEGEYLEEKLGWIGRLVRLSKEGPEGETRKSLLAEAASFATSMLVLIFALLAIVGLSGLGMFSFIALSFTRVIKAKTVPNVGHGFIYLETFTIWMLVFLCISIAMSTFSAFKLLPKEALMWGQVVAFPGSLIAVLWPMLRGVSWSQIRKDIGWECDNVLKECFCGVYAYFCGIPILVLAMVVSGFLIFLTSGADNPLDFNPPAGPSHPINEEIQGGGFGATLAVILLACVMAPLVEETVFRGVFYRYLRDYSFSSFLPFSALVSAVISGFIFAAIHPQGILLVPPLMALGIVFAFAREWRNSLVASMTMHAIHNSMIMIGMLTFMGS